MVTGEKDVEFRNQSQWIKSRVFNKDGTIKQYDAVKFINGYGNDKPYFIAEFKTVNRSPFDDYMQHYNGLHFMVRKGDIKIFLGRILEVGNFNK